MYDMKVVCGKYGRIYIASVKDGLITEEMDVTNDVISAVALHLDHESGPEGIIIKTRMGTLSWSKKRCGAAAMDGEI